MILKKKLFIVSIASSSEYGSCVESTQVFTNKQKAHKALNDAYKEALADISWEEYVGEKPKPLGNVTHFEVSDYECSYQCASGRIFEKEISINLDINI